ncbi:alpha/beta hydrolase [Zwartia sp.]|uniref:alpha/beta hydrolase n=1 Tax=Zwartia sp. TaxID=2978004 RepID=UPI003BB0A6B9
MTKPTKETIADLLVRNVPREVIMGIEDALAVGAQRAYFAARGMDDGHLPSVVGQLRHFHMNESFQRALVVNNASPSPIRGNAIVTGRTGIFTLARFNIKEGIWINGRRSQTRRQMSMANMAIEPLVQPELFSDYEPPSQAVAFFVACFAASLHIQPESPVSIQIAVPNRDMNGWLFREPITAFAKRYDHKPESQQGDLAKPKLKKSIGKQNKNGTTQ